MLDMTSILLLCSDYMFSFYVYALVLHPRVDNLALILSSLDFIIPYVHISTSRFLMFTHLFAVVNWVLYTDVSFVCICIICYLAKVKCWTPIKHLQRYSKDHKPSDVIVSSCFLLCSYIFFYFYFKLLLLFVVVATVLSCFYLGTIHKVCML